MSEIISWILSLHNSESMLQMLAQGGLVVAALIIFSETGLLAGFFLPGDSLLITVGVLTQEIHPLHIAGFDLWIVQVVLVLAAILGDSLGYFLGFKAGNAIFERPDGRFFKRKYLQAAHEFYERHGPKAVIGCRFIPIFRTFVPFAAGVARMPYRRYIVWSVLGGMLWILSLTWLGNLLGQTPLANRLDKLIVVVVFVSMLPVMTSALKVWLNSRKERQTK
jgi:membrane-associated protein